LAAAQCTTAEMGEMGKGTVQENKCHILEDQVQGATRPVRTLVIGMSMKTAMFEWLINMKSSRQNSGQAV